MRLDVDTSTTARDRSAARPTIGIFGAGKAGTALARLTVAAGHPTLVAGSPRAQDLDLLLELMVPGAEAVDGATLARRADVVVLLAPFSRRAELPLEELDGRIVVDAMNYWPPVDGTDPEVEVDGRGTTEIVAQRNPRARWVKSFSHLGYHDLEDDPRPPGASDRRAIAVVSDDPRAAEVVAELVDRLGFDPVTAAPMTRGRLLQPGGGLFGVRLTAEQMHQALFDSDAAVPPGTSRQLV
jgi:8-hydroxy-5-deazaflavin:NADPH oxidoreductase